MECESCSVGTVILGLFKKASLGINFTFWASGELRVESLAISYFVKEAKASDSPTALIPQGGYPFVHLNPRKVEEIVNLSSSFLSTQRSVAPPVLFNKEKLLVYYDNCNHIILLLLLNPQ